MVRSRQTAILFGILASLLPLRALAWIDTGHMVVAAIAAKGLTPSVKAKVDTLLLVGGDEKTREFRGAACWADDTKTRETGPWHYIDNYFRDDGSAPKNKPDAENVVWAIDKFSKVLADKSAGDADRADALRYLLHFVGDSHQPLHAVSRETSDRPDGDRGGNLFKLQPIAEISMRRPNLHLLWDFGCGLFTSVPRPLTAEGSAQIDSLAAQIMGDYPESSLKGADNLDPAAWTSESASIARAVVYQLQEDTTPSNFYLSGGKKVCEQRLALAGYRLAHLLNKLLR